MFSLGNDTWVVRTYDMCACKGVQWHPSAHRFSSQWVAVYLVIPSDDIDVDDAVPNPEVVRASRRLRRRCQCLLTTTYWLPRQQGTEVGTCIVGKTYLGITQIGTVGTTTATTQTTAHSLRSTATLVPTAIDTYFHTRVSQLYRKRKRQKKTPPKEEKKPGHQQPRDQRMRDHHAPG